MPSEKDFSLISVSSDEEDDIVIQAGAVSAPASEAGVEAGEADDYEDFGDYEDEVVEAGATGAAGAGSDASAGDGALADDAADAATEEAPAPRRAQAANGMLTSEEDLNAPMPYAGMQRAIMIGFVLLLLAAVAYWFFIRPVSG